MSSSAQGGPAVPSSSCDDQQAQAQAQQLLNVKVGKDKELAIRQTQLRELMKLYNAPDTRPGIREQIRQHLITLFVTTEFSPAERRMLELLFRVTPYTEGMGLDEEAYRSHVKKFIDDKCLVALTELLTIPKLFNLVVELFLTFFYGKSKVRMAIAAVSGGAHAIAAASAAIPLGKTSAQGIGLALNVMFRLFKLVTDPTAFFKEMDGGVVQELMSQIPGSDSAKHVCEYVIRTANGLVRATVTPLILANILSEAISKLFDCLSTLPPPAQGAAQPAAVPNAPVSILWRGGMYVIDGAVASAEHIRKHVTKIFQQGGVAQLGDPQNTYVHGILTYVLNTLTIMSGKIDAQAAIVSSPEEADRVKAMALFNALIPPNLRDALAEGNMRAAETEINMFLAALKDPVVKLCTQERVIPPEILSIIAPWTMGVGEITKELLEEFLRQFPPPHYAEVELSDTMRGEASQFEESERDATLDGDLEKLFRTAVPLTPAEVAIRQKSARSIFSLPAAGVAVVSHAAWSFYRNRIAPSCGKLLSEAHDLLHPGVSPSAVCSRGPLHETQVIMSGIRHIIEKQLRNEELSNEEAILLNSYLNIWSGDPNKLSYGQRTYKNGTTGKCWFLHLETTIYVLEDDIIKRARKPGPLGETKVEMAVRTAVELGRGCAAAANDSAMKVVSAVGGGIKAVMEFIDSDQAEDSDTTFTIMHGVGDEFNVIPASSGTNYVPGSPLGEAALNDAAADALMTVAVMDAANEAEDAGSSEIVEPIDNGNEDNPDPSRSVAGFMPNEPEGDVMSQSYDGSDDDNTPPSNGSGTKKQKTEGGKSRRKSRKNSKKTTRRNKGRKSSNTAKKSQQQRLRNSIRRRRSSRKGRK
jgi:hypothetical protein